MHRIPRHTGLSALAALLLPLLCPAPARPQDAPCWVERSRISGYMFGDLYWVAANHEAAIEGRSGAWFRRIYFTFDHAVDDAFAIRLRLEMNQPGDFTSEGKLTPFVKDAYLRWRPGAHAVYLGLSPTPTWELVEDFWGYRSVEKTPLDLYRMGSSRDLGIAASGRLNARGTLRYHAMVANGSGTGTETNSGKKLMLSLSGHPTGSLVLEAYGDYEDRPGHTDRTTIQAFAGYRTARGRLGLQLARQRRKMKDGEVLDLDVASAFGAAALTPTVSVLARYDRMFDPNSEGAKISYLPFDPGAASHFLLAGIDFTVGRQINLIPNVEAVLYDGLAGGGERPDSDLFLRFTFFARF